MKQMEPKECEGWIVRDKPKESLIRRLLQENWAMNMIDGMNSNEGKFTQNGARL